MLFALRGTREETVLPTSFKCFAADQKQFIYLRRWRRRPTSKC